ncbi:MAG: SRPBCC family protein [Actinomycetota bacterium]
MEGDVLLEVTEAVSVEAPPEVVWELVTDVSRHPEFAGSKSMTKAIEFEGPLEVGARWNAHEKFWGRKFDAPSEITALEPKRAFEWVSYPPMKDENRGKGGRAYWKYVLTPENSGTRLEHTARILEPKKGAGALKAFYRLINASKRNREAIMTSLNNIKATDAKTGHNSNLMAEMDLVRPLVSARQLSRQGKDRDPMSHGLLEGATLNPESSAASHSLLSQHANVTSSRDSSAITSADARCMASKARSG